MTQLRFAGARIGARVSKSYCAKDPRATKPCSEIPVLFVRLGSGFEAVIFKLKSVAGKYIESNLFAFVKKTVSVKALLLNHALALMILATAAE